MKYSDSQLTLWKDQINAISILSTRIKLTKENKEAVGLCPFHDEKTGSFKIYKKDGWWQCHCHGACGKTWNVFQVVQHIDKLSFDDAVEKVLSQAGWEEGKEMVESVFAPVLTGDKKYLTYPLDCLKVSEKALAESQDARNWLSSRGITYETAKSLKIGFVQNLKAVNPNHPWVSRGWIVIPYIDNDVITCLKYRSLVGKKSDDGKISGILRGPQMATSLYNMSACSLWNDVFLTEGEPDVWTLTQAGYDCVGFPSAEYTPTPAERDTLAKTNRIFLAGDSDAPGQAAMTKLWKEIRDRAYLLEWPSGCKDANDALMKECQGDTEKFQELIEILKAKALERPIPDFYDVRQSLRNADDTNPMENPRRLHFSLRAVDEMAVTLPGNVVSVFATYTGSGKTTWCLDSFELEEVMKHGSVLLNYSAELSPQEFSMLVAANLLGKDRLTLTREDFTEAANMLDAVDAKMYIGYNPDLSKIGPVLDSLEWAIRRLGANIVVLDHLHFLCRGERDDIKAQADAMQRIKNLAVKYQIIFVVVGQSRKEQPNRKGRPSEASDAKGSETFISDASTTYHIHRNLKRDIDWEHPETFPTDMLDTTTDLRLYKCRTKGPGKAVCRLIFDGKVGKFYPYTTQNQGEHNA